MRTFDYSTSQLPEDELMELVARHEAEHEYEKWDNRRLLKKAREFRWTGGIG